MSTATATYKRKNRVYEPVQDPTSQQGFNRYAYCFYNPLKYVDPSGERCYGPSEAEIVQRAINEARQRCWRETYRMLEEQEAMYRQIKDGQHPFGWGGKSSSGGVRVYNSGTGNGYCGKGGWCRDKSGNMTYNPDATTSTEGFLGVTYKDNKTNTYYGLFGGTYDLTTEKGRFCQACDQALINYVKDSREPEYIDPFDVSVPVSRRTYFGDVEGFVGNEWNNDDTHRYEGCYFDDDLGVLARCGNDYNMWLTFCGWSGSENEMSLQTYNQSLSSTFPSGYILCFESHADHGCYKSAFVIFPSREARNNIYSKYKQIFGIP